MALHERQAVGWWSPKGVTPCGLHYISGPIRLRSL